MRKNFLFLAFQNSFVIVVNSVTKISSAINFTKIKPNSLINNGTYRKNKSRSVGLIKFSLNLFLVHKALRKLPSV